MLEFISLNKTAAGTNPKLISSASESNSFPIGEDTFKALAIKPSQKSNIVQNMTNIKVT